jgi:hypothetical protein
MERYLKSVPEARAIVAAALESRELPNTPAGLLELHRGLAVCADSVLVLEKFYRMTKPTRAKKGVRS